MDNVTPYILLLIGLAMLTKGADWLVEGASSLARRLGVSDLVVGLTVVAFGTSAPELLVNVLSSAGDHSQIALGNVLGSNIFNILFILGVCGLIRPLQIIESTVWKEIPLSFLAALLVGITANDAAVDGTAANVLGRIDGLVLLSFFLIFLFYVIESARNDRASASNLNETGESLPTGKTAVYVLAGLLALGLGAQWMVQGAVEMARGWGVSETLIGLTIVSAGTSLPELATSLAAAKKGNADIAVGNVVGSNIFNIFFILGLSATIRPLPLGPGANADIAVAALASLLLFAAAFTGRRKRLDRWEGGLLVACFAAYLVYVIGRG